MSGGAMAEGAGRYAALLESVWGGGGATVAEEAGGERVLEGELALQSRWFAGEWGTRLRTTDGRAVEVVDFGVWNHAAGPDFVDVVVLLDGERRKGAVELDVEARDWEAHGHGENGAFEEVVLHVFFGDAGRGRFFTRTCEGREVAQVRLDAAGGEGAAARLRWRRGLLP